MKTRHEVAEAIRRSATPEEVADAITDAADEYEAEIARLRKIEEAARAYREAASSLLGHVDFGRLRKGGDAAQQAWLVADRALRTALEADR